MPGINETSEYTVAMMTEGGWVIVSATNPPEIESGWMKVDQAAEFLSMPRKTLINYLTSGKVSKRCARQIGKVWYLNRKVLEREHIVFTGEEHEQKK